MEQEQMQVKEGMHVIDTNGEELGTIHSIQFSDEDRSKPGPETTTAAEAYYENNSFFRTLVKALRGKVDLPDEVAARLMREGYIRIDGGIARSDAYATMDQIAHTHDDHVHLNVAEGQLIRL